MMKLMQLKNYAAYRAFTRDEATPEQVQLIMADKYDRQALEKLKGSFKWEHSVQDRLRAIMSLSDKLRKRGERSW